MGGPLVNRLKISLSKTRENFQNILKEIITGRVTIEEDLWEELTELLIQADLGVKTTSKVVTDLKDKVLKEKIAEPSQLPELLKEELLSLLPANSLKINTSKDTLTVILMVGVNGGGKTTTIGKLAYRFKREGRKVLLAAADTFRAAAVEQLEVWGRRVGTEVIKQRPGADPAAVVYDALSAGLSRGVDILIIDTAGRLHTKVNLMEELKKIRKVIKREIPQAPQEVLLVLDATIGQNALSQALIFKQAIGLTGIVLTKLDGTAKGGIIIAIFEELKVPVKLVGTGERLEDLSDFNSFDFVSALIRC